MKIEVQNSSIAISGMMCADCVRKVQAALETVAGIEVVHIEIGRAIVKCEDAASCESACKAITAAGFPANQAKAFSTETEKEREKTVLASQDMVNEGGGSAGVALGGSNVTATENKRGYLGNAAI